MWKFSREKETPKGSEGNSGTDKNAISKIEKSLEWKKTDDIKQGLVNSKTGQ